MPLVTVGTMENEVIAANITQESVSKETHGLNLRIKSDGSTKRFTQ